MSYEVELELSHGTQSILTRKISPLSEARYTRQLGAESKYTSSEF